MNKKDYVEIAKIIKKQLHHCADNTKYELNNIIEELADYFEDEDIDSLNEKLNRVSIDNITLSINDANRINKNWNEFDKKKFLKDCGGK